MSRFGDLIAGKTTPEPVVAEEPVVAAKPVDAKIGLNIAGKVIVLDECFSVELSADSPKNRT